MHPLVKVIIDLILPPTRGCNRARLRKSNKPGYDLPVDYRSPTPWLLGGVLVLAGVGAVHALSNASGTIGCKPTVKTGDRVLLFGDSLAVGLSTPLREIASKSGCEFQALAKSGTSMAHWLGERRADLEATIARLQPTVVLVSLGTNDSKGMTSEEKLATQIASIAELVGKTSKLLWVRPPKLPFADRVSAAITSQGIAAFDSAALPIPQADGIHPTGRGYAGWAEHLWASMTCSTTPVEALSGIRAPSVPRVPAFLRPARIALPASATPKSAAAPRGKCKKSRGKTHWKV